MAKRRSRGEGSLFYSEKKGLWVAEFTLNGKSRRKYEKTQKEARGWLLEMRKQAAGGMVVDDRKLTVSKFVDRWFEDVAKPSLRPATIQAHESIIRNHIKPEIGDIRLSELTPLQLQTLCSQKLKSGLSNRTVKYIRTIMHQALDQALEWGLVARNVTDAVKHPRLRESQLCLLPKSKFGDFWIFCKTTACSPYMWYTLVAD